MAPDGASALGSLLCPHANFISTQHVPNIVQLLNRQMAGFSTAHHIPINQKAAKDATSSSSLVDNSSALNNNSVGEFKIKKKLPPSNCTLVQQQVLVASRKQLKSGAIVQASQRNRKVSRVLAQNCPAADKIFDYKSPGLSSQKLDPETLLSRDGAPQTSYNFSKAKKSHQKQIETKNKLRVTQQMAGAQAPSFPGRTTQIEKCDLQLGPKPSALKSQHSVKTTRQ